MTCFPFLLVLRLTTENLDSLPNQCSRVHLLWMGFLKSQYLPYIDRLSKFSWSVSQHLHEVLDWHSIWQTQYDRIDEYYIKQEKKSRYLFTLFSFICIEILHKEHWLSYQNLDYQTMNKSSIFQLRKLFTITLYCPFSSQNLNVVPLVEMIANVS